MHALNVLVLQSYHSHKSRTVTIQAQATDVCWFWWSREIDYIRMFWLITDETLHSLSPDVCLGQTLQFFLQKVRSKVRGRIWFCPCLSFLYNASRLVKSLEEESVWELVFVYIMMCICINIHVLINIRFLIILDPDWTKFYLTSNIVILPRTPSKRNSSFGVGLVILQVYSLFSKQELAIIIK